MANKFVKDPDAVLDYAFDWSAWLDDGETIDGYTIVVPSGLTKEDDTESAGIVTVWLSGGTAGKTYLVVCRIETSSNRTEDRSMRIVVADR